MPTKYSSRDADKFVIRLPDGMRSRVDQQAKAGHRSMNSWFIQTIEDALVQAEAKEGSSTPVPESIIPVFQPQTRPWTPAIGMAILYKGQPDIITELIWSAERKQLSAVLKYAKGAVPIYSINPLLVTR